MADLELIGKIIADSFFSDRCTSVGVLENVADTIIISSDNEEFHAHKVMIDSRWVYAPIYLNANDKFQMDLEISSSLVALLIDFFHYRLIRFATLDAALDLYKFGATISNQQLQKLCLDGIKAKMTQIDVLKVWNQSKTLKLHASIIEYVTFHFPAAFEEYEQVRQEFNAMSLRDAIQLLKLRKLNIKSESEVVKFIMSWIDANAENIDVLQYIDAFIGAIRVQKDRAMFVLPSLMPLKDKYSFDCKVLSSKLLRRIPRNFLVFYGLYNKRNPIAYTLDLEAQKLCRMQTLDNYDYSVAVPNFCVANGTLHQIGGNTSNSLGFAKADCFALDNQTLKWKRKSSIPFERAYSNVCGAENGNIFIVGGHSLLPRSRMRNVDIYDPARNTWKSLPRMSTGRLNASSVFIDGKLIVTGGATEERSINDCEYLPRLSESWFMMPQLNYARSAHQTIVYRGEIYVLGGRNGIEELASVEKLSLNLNGLWKEMPPMSVKRSNFAAAVFDDKLFVFGGENSHCNLAQTIEYFDGTSWHQFGHLPADVTPLAALIWKNVPYAERLLKNDSFDSLSLTSIEEEEQTCNQYSCCNTAIQGA